MILILKGSDYMWVLGWRCWCWRWCWWCGILLLSHSAVKQWLHEKFYFYKHGINKNKLGNYKHDKLWNKYFGCVFPFLKINHQIYKDVIRNETTHFEYFKYNFIFSYILYTFIVWYIYHDSVWLTFYCTIIAHQMIHLG